MYLKRAFSLIEMLIALSIVGLVVLFTLPMVTNYMEQTRANTRIIQLYNTLVFARSTALASDQNIIICPSEDTNQCGGSWSKDLMVFSDTNKNQRHDQGEQILRILAPNTAGALTWKGFGSSNYLKFVPYGFTNQQNGTFIYCSPSHQFTLSRGIIVNKSGRVRFAEITDGGGIIDASGHQVYC